jgi:hypothetical protein
MKPLVMETAVLARLQEMAAAKAVEHRRTAMQMAKLTVRQFLREVPRRRKPPRT